MSALTHKGYVSGPIEFDAEDQTFHGQVAGLRDVITFEAATGKQLEKAFRESIDVYLEVCAEEGTPPEKSYSGFFNVRTTPEVHRRIALASAAAGESLNAWVTKRLEETVSEEPGSTE